MASGDLLSSYVTRILLRSAFGPAAVVPAVNKNKNKGLLQVLQLQQQQQQGGRSTRRTLFTSSSVAASSTWGGGGGGGRGHLKKWWVTSRNIISLGWQGIRSRSALHSWTIWNTSRRETTFVINSSKRRLTPVLALALALPLTFPLAKLVLTHVACEDPDNKSECLPDTDAANKPCLSEVSNTSQPCTSTPPSPSSTHQCVHHQHACTSNSQSSSPPPTSTCNVCSAGADCRNNNTKKNCETTSATNSCGKENCCAKKNGKAQINWCLDEDLSHKMLIKQANQLTVDSITRLVTQTISAYQDYHEEYRRLICMLMDSLEDSRNAQGINLELLDCKLIMLRAKVDDMKCAILELESYLYSVQKLAEAAAETSFLGHAEYASVAMSERIHSATQEVNNIKAETLRRERDMMELQTIVIVESGKSLK